MVTLQHLLTSTWLTQRVISWEDRSTKSDGFLFNLINLFTQQAPHLFDDEQTCSASHVNPVRRMNSMCKSINPCWNWYTFSTPEQCSAAAVVWYYMAVCVLKAIKVSVQLLTRRYQIFVDVTLNTSQQNYPVMIRVLATTESIQNCACQEPVQSDKDRFADLVRAWRSPEYKELSAYMCH